MIALDWPIGGCNGSTIRARPLCVTQDANLGSLELVMVWVRGLWQKEATAVTFKACGEVAVVEVKRSSGMVFVMLIYIQSLFCWMNYPVFARIVVAGIDRSILSFSFTIYGLLEQ